MFAYTNVKYFLFIILCKMQIFQSSNILRKFSSLSKKKKSHKIKSQKSQNFNIGIDCISIGRMKERTLGSISSYPLIPFWKLNDLPTWLWFCKKKKKAKNSLNSESTIQVHKQLRTKTQTSTTNQGTGHLVMMPITQDTMQKEGRGKGRKEGREGKRGKQRYQLWSQTK